VMCRNTVQWLNPHPHLVPRTWCFESRIQRWWSPFGICWRCIHGSCLIGQPWAERRGICPESLVGSSVSISENRSRWSRLSSCLLCGIAPRGLYLWRAMVLTSWKFNGVNLCRADSPFFVLIKIVYTPANIGVEVVCTFPDYVHNLIEL